MLHYVHRLVPDSVSLLDYVACSEFFYFTIFTETAAAWLNEKTSVKPKQWTSAVKNIFEQIQIIMNIWKGFNFGCQFLLSNTFFWMTSSKEKQMCLMFTTVFLLFSSQEKKKL